MHASDAWGLPTRRARPPLRWWEEEPAAHPSASSPAPIQDFAKAARMSSIARCPASDGPAEAACEGSLLEHVQRRACRAPNATAGVVPIARLGPRVPGVPLLNRRSCGGQCGSVLYGSGIDSASEVVGSRNARGCAQCRFVRYGASPRRWSSRPSGGRRRASP